VTYQTIRYEQSEGIALARQMSYRTAAQPHPLEAHRVDSLAMFYTSAGDGKEGVRAFLEKRAPELNAQLSRGLPPLYRERVDSMNAKRKKAGE
jgi:hypothetical protein